MRTFPLSAVVASGLCASVAGVAHADHAGMDMSGMDMSGSTQHAAPVSTVTASVSLVAAQFDTMYYSGDYQGAVPTVAWAYGPYSIGAALPLYHLDANGNGSSGLGDAMIHAGVTLVHHDDTTVGAIACATVPTGDQSMRFGMGAVMVMPSVWASQTLGRVTASASAGYSRALGGMSDVEMHGMMSLVEPMNMQELTWAGGVDVKIAAGIRAGARMTGGVPIADPGGAERVVAAGHVSWGNKQLETSGELQAGLVGDPFSIRAVITTALRF